MIGTTPNINGGAAGPSTASSTTNAGNSAVIQTGGGNKNGAGSPEWAWVAIAVAIAAVAYAATRKKK